MQNRDFLQTIKLEISKNFKLQSYERIAMHNVLALNKTNASVSVLEKELHKTGPVRASAVNILTGFDLPEITNKLVPILKKDPSETETVSILRHISRFGTPELITEIIDFIIKLDPGQTSPVILDSAFTALREVGFRSGEVLDFLLGIIGSDEYPDTFKSCAIKALSSFNTVSIYEDILKSGNDILSYNALISLFNLNKRLISVSSTLQGQTGQSEEKLILDIRVLLGKTSPRFDTFSNRTKNIYIACMITTNHREAIIYITRALTSGDRELVNMTLLTLYQNIEKIKDPDKLFRTLIMMTLESTDDNRLLADIFVRYFSKIGDNRTNHILKDKLYGYMVVTLESYFETYRREFMIKDVVEKSFPENFRIVRSFILEKLNPEIKKHLVYVLNSEDSTSIRHTIEMLNKYMPHIEQEDKKSLEKLLELLFDNDRKSRENSALRIDDIDFEKRYLRDRIIRLSHIIAKLKINDSASALVNIYNYLKKYPDQKIMSSIVNTLSELNYSYMLGEIELLISTPDPADTKRALDLISIFTDQRSINILLEFINANSSLQGEALERAIQIVGGRDIKNNSNALRIILKVLENNRDTRIVSEAITALGKCGLETEIETINDFFHSSSDSQMKENCVKAIGEILTRIADFNKRTVIRYLKDYLKDSSIRVRIYSCLYLIKLGDSEALKMIRDMLVIKNRSVQRDILIILEGLQSLEYSFFLISLLKQEYGLSKDITSAIAKVPSDDLIEINSFIVNLFKKFEQPDTEDVQARDAFEETFLKKETFLMIIDTNFSSKQYLYPSEKIDDSLNLKATIYGIVNKNGGSISAYTESKILTYYDDPLRAVVSSIEILEHFETRKAYRLSCRDAEITFQLISDTAFFAGDEIVDYNHHRLANTMSLPLDKKTIIQPDTSASIIGVYSLKPISELLFLPYSPPLPRYEVLNTTNLLYEAEAMVNSFIKDKEQKEKYEENIEHELKRLKRRILPSSSISVSRDLENIGIRIAEQLEEIEKYVQRRSTDRELIKNVRKMTLNVYNTYKVEISRLIID